MVESRCLGGVRRRNCAKTEPNLRNDEGGTILAQGPEAFLDHLFSFGVNSASGFIKQNDFWLL